MYIYLWGAPHAPGACVQSGGRTKLLPYLVLTRLGLARNKCARLSLEESHLRQRSGGGVVTGKSRSVSSASSPPALPSAPIHKGECFHTLMGGRHYLILTDISTASCDNVFYSLVIYTRRNSIGGHPSHTGFAPPSGTLAYAAGILWT